MCWCSLSFYDDIEMKKERDRKKDELGGESMIAGTRFGSLKCDYSGTPPFADAEWVDDPDPLCLWCAGTGHPYGDESYGICECPKQRDMYLEESV